MRALKLESRGLIKIDGSERKSFLQGLITHDIALLTDGGILYAALLTPQGKVMWDFFLYEVADCIYLDAERDQIAALMMRLTMYKLRADVILTDVSDALSVYAIFDARADAALTCCYDPRVNDQSMGGRAIVDNSATFDHSLISFEEYETLRISKGLPDGRRDIMAEKNFGLEVNLDRINGVGFTKGCFVGQELTARMHHRTTVKKRLVVASVEGDAPEHGTPIVTKDGKTVGDIRSSIGNKALAFIKLEYIAEDLTADGRAVTCEEIGHEA